MKKLLSYIILAFVLVFIIVFFARQGRIIEILRNIQIMYLIPLLMFTFLSIFMNGLQIKFITKVYGKNLSLKEWFGLSVINTFTNHIAPFRGGMAVKAVYLKKVHRMPYTLFVTTAGAVSVLSMFVYSLLGVIASVIYGLGWVITGIFGSTFVIMGFISFLLPYLPLTKYKKLNYLVMSINGLKDLRKNLKSVVILFLVNLGLLIVTALKFYYTFQALSYNLSLTFCFVISLFTALSLIISVMPANLGVSEAIITFSAKAFGVATAVGLSAAILDRVTTIVFVFLTGPIFTYILLKRSSR